MVSCIIEQYPELIWCLSEKLTILKADTTVMATVTELGISGLPVQMPL